MLGPRFASVVALSAIAIGIAPAQGQTQGAEVNRSNLPIPDPAFKGKIGTTFEDSTPDFPQPVQAPKGAPNVVVILLDDIGFGQPGTFGGPVPTPALDRLAAEGLRYNRFHTTAICSPTGELLEGWYQDWCLFERERFQYMFLGMLDKLMGYCEGLRAYEEGIAYGMQILRRDQAREHTHRRLMRLHFLSGNRTEALRQFHRCAAILMDELGVQPADETHQLYQQIQENRLDLSPSQVRGAGPNPSRSLLALDGLKAVQTELLSLQRRLRQEIELVELVLKGRR